MDVTCDRCGTDYEFEETLVSTRGTTVKCTQCGHLFKIYKRESPTETSSESSAWTVRTVDGTTHELASLADLTRLIGEGVFGREDEVSRTGRAWKKLGEIEELASFFPGSEHPSTRPPRRRTATSPDLGLQTQPSVRPSAPPLPRGVSVPPSAPLPPAADPVEPKRRRVATPPQAVRFETMGSEVELGPRGEVRGEGRIATPVAPGPTAAPPHAAAHPAAHSPAPDAAETATTSRRRAITLESQAPAPAASRAPVAPLPEPPAAPPVARSRAWLLPSVLTLSLLAVAFLLVWPSLQHKVTPPKPRDPSAEFMARGDAAFATHRVQHFGEAITEYVKALAHHESDPHVLSSISRVYAVWSQELAFKIEALRATTKAEDVERLSEIGALEKEKRQLSEHAKRYAETAARKNPGNEEAELALADALRLSGNLVAARSELDRASASRSAASAESLRVAALLAIDEASGNLRAGLKLASLAVAQEPDLIRTRLLLARCLAADGDVAGARYHLDAVVKRDRSHPGVIAVEQELERPKPTEAAAEPVAAQPPELPAPVEAKVSTTVSPPEDLSHEGYITRGQALLEQGHVAQAKRMFEQALFMKPSSAQAHTGLGYVALEKGRPQLAVEHFLPAARHGNGEALIGLGDAYRRLKRPRDALKAYQTFLSREPSGPRANIARAQIERLNEELNRKGS